jgi:hypothetical protein
MNQMIRGVLLLRKNRLKKSHASVNLKGTNSKRGRDQSHLICGGKLEAHPFLFLHFKETPSQEEHKTIFSDLKISNGFVWSN